MRSATFIFIRRDLSLNIGNFISFVEVYVGNWIWKCAGLISSPWYTLGCATFHLVLISVTFLHVSPHLFLWAVLGGPYFHAHGLLPSFTCPIYRYFTILRKPRGKVNIDQYWYNNLALFWWYLSSLLKISVIFCLMFTQHLFSFVFVYLLSKYRLPLFLVYIPKFFPILRLRAISWSQNPREICAKSESPQNISTHFYKTDNAVHNSVIFYWPPLRIVIFVTRNWIRPSDVAIFTCPPSLVRHFRPHFVVLLETFLLVHFYVPLVTSLAVRGGLLPYATKKVKSK